MRHLIAFTLIAGCSTARTIPTAPLAPPASGRAASGGNLVAPDELGPALRVSGNTAFPTSRLRTEVAAIACDVRHQVDVALATVTTGTETPECATPEDFRVTLEVFYLTHGYVDAKVTLVPASRRTPATIAIEEGRRYRIGSVVTVDAIAVKDSLADATALAHVIDLEPGRPFERDAIRAAVQRITDRYDEAGYGLATVLPLTKVDRADHRIDLTLEIERGPIAKVAAIEVLGERAARLPATARELDGVRLGEVFSSREMRRAEERLRATGKFTRVGIAVDWVGPSGGDQVKLTVFAD